MSIDELRNKGYKIRIIHYRTYLSNCLTDNNNKRVLSRFEAEKEGIFNSLYGPQSFGGMTKVELRSPDGTEVTGESMCSMKDQFSRRFGRDIAIGRALAKLR